MHMYIGVAVDKSKFEGQNLDDIVINILCKHIPDLFDSNFAVVEPPNYYAYSIS